MMICFLCRRRFDFQSPSRMDRNVEMFMQIEKALISNKCHVQPCIYLKPNLDKALTARLKDIIKRHQGNLVEDVDDATHIIHVLPANHGQQEGMLLFTKLRKNLDTPKNAVTIKKIDT